MNPYSIRFKPDAKVVELGGGDNPLKDNNGNRLTYNVDVRSSPEVDVVADFNKPLPFDDNSYDGVFSQYAIEHIEWRNVEGFIKEIHRILKPSGKAIIITANLYEQCKKVVDEGVNEGAVEMIFGSQEFENFGGCHKCGFSFEYAKKLFKDIGFNFIKTLPHPATVTDLIIEAYKMNENNIFERAYFDADGDIGYVGTGYRNFTTHYATANKLLNGIIPANGKVLEIGAARGYVTRILENNGIKAVAMDVSKHCYHTRATNSFILHDIIDVPWHKARVFADKEFDLCFSQNVLEHIPEEQIDKVITEIVRVSHKGLHGVHYLESGYEESPDVDITHCTMYPKSWWIDKFKTIAPDYPVTIMYPRELENDDVEKCIAYPPKPPDNLVKLNIGSFMDMFYYGWTNTDIIDLQAFAQSQGYIFQQHDILQRIPYADNGIDLIFSSHLLEHLSREDGAKFLKECHRALKPNGIIRISVPDAVLITQNYLNGQIMEYKYINVGVEKADDDAQAFHELLMSGHSTVYDEIALKRILEAVGFKLLPSITPFTSNSEAIQKQTITNFPNLSLVIEAKKP